LEAVTFTLNGTAVSARAGKTILEVAREHGIDIPTLCHHELLRPIGACRLCQVEDEKRGLVVPACVTTVQAGMVINTHSPRVIRNRTNIIRLLLASHPESCLVCEKGNRCELRKLAARMGVGEPDLDRMPYHPAVVDLNPVISRDLSKCILCGKCIRADQEVVVEGVIDYNKRGFDAHPATLFLEPLEKAECTLCGTCLSVCPTGALQEKGRLRLDYAGARTASVCSLCACGCSIFLEHDHQAVTGVSPTARPHTANGISLCVKGHFGHDYLSSPDRLRSPLLKTEDGFQPIGWDKALDLAAARFRDIAATAGPKALGFLGGSRSSNEEAYLFQKLAREVLGSPNLDSLSRLYWGPAARVLLEAAGSAAGTGSFKDLEASDAVLVVGADPTRTAPVLGYHLKRAVRFGRKKLILLDPLETKLAPLAEVWLRPGPAADGPALAGLVKAVLESGAQPGREKSGAGFEQVSVAECAARAGLAEEDLRRAAGLLAQAERGFIVFGGGLLQQPEAAQLTGLLVSLARLTGWLGRPGAGLLPLLKDCNAQGALDLGLAPDLLPGHRPAAETGLDARQMVSAAAQGRLKGLYVLAENPLGVLPDPEAAGAALAGLDFLVVQDMFLTETAKLAHLVLPAAGLAEKDGTLTSLERRLQRFERAVPPPGDFPPEWRVLTEMARRLGQDWSYDSAGDVLAEIGRRVPLYGGPAGADLEGQAVFWPLPGPSETGAGGSQALVPEPGLSSETGDGYPFVLMQGHLLEHLGGGARTSHSRRLSQLAPAGFIGLAPADLEALGLAEGDGVRVSSAHGQLEGPARPDARLPQGVVFAPASFPGWRPGVLFGGEAAGLKHCRVRLEKI